MASFAGFWHGPPLTTVHHACLRSFSDYGHAFDLYSYEPIDVAHGIRIRDAAEILPKQELFYFHNSTTRESEVAPFSDLFRLKVLWRFGGWWCDVDTMCLSENMPECRYAWARDNPEFHPELVANGILHFPPHDEIVELAYDRAHQLKASIGERTQLGAKILSPMLRELGMPLDITISTSTVYPLRWIEMFKLVIPDFAEEVHARLESAILLTLSWSFFKNAGIDLRLLPPEGSVLDMLLRRHGSHLDRIGYRYTREEVTHLIRHYFRKVRSWAIPELLAASGPDTVRWMLPELRSDVLVASNGRSADSKFAVKRLFLSPHFDDAVGSCGGIIARLTADGRRAEVLTVFGGAEHLPLSDLAAALHRQWGIDPAVAVRKAEEAAALRVLGATSWSLDIPEAIYRRSDNRSPLYPALEALFGEPAEEDRQLPDAIMRAIAQAYPASDTIIVAPSGNGSHVDHLLVNRAARQLLSRGYRVLFYQDFTYDTGPSGMDEVPGLGCRNLMLTGAELQRKEAALRSYASQLEFLFGDLHRFAAYIKDKGSVESFTGPESTLEPTLAAFLGEATRPDASRHVIEPHPHGPKVSVIVPVYNKAEFLAECLDSIRNQTLSDLEIICIDDASTDELTRILADLAQREPRLRIHRNASNLGPGPTRNIGIENARGTYVQFTDADDLLPAGAIGMLFGLAASTGSAAVRGSLQPFPEGANKRWLDERCTALVAPDRRRFPVGVEPVLWVPWFHTAYLFSLNHLRAFNIRYPDLRDGEDPVFLATVLSTIEHISASSEVCYLYRTEHVHQRSALKHKVDYLRHLCLVKQAYDTAAHRHVWQYGCSPFYMKVFKEMFADLHLDHTDFTLVSRLIAQVWSRAELLAAGIQMTDQTIRLIPTWGRPRIPGPLHRPAVGETRTW